MRFCARCDKPLLPSEESESVDKDSTSGGGVTLEVHAELCVRPPTQTAPIRPPAATVRADGREAPRC